MQHSGTNWLATLKDGSSEVYSSTGQLIQLITPGGLITTLTYNSTNQLVSVRSPFGQALQFSYNSSNQLQQLIDPASKIVTYAYGANNNLTSVTYQDSTTRQYLYANSTFPNNLTGIVDESNSQFLSVQYDPTTGAVTSSQQAGGVQAISLSYSANGAVATDALGATHTYTFTNDPSYAPRVTALSINTLTQTFAVSSGATDAQRRVTQRVDANNDITRYAYDPDHLTSKTEAFGTSVARTISYQYLSSLSALPTLVTEPLRQISYQYYPSTNNVNTKTITDTSVTPSVSRTWTYTYDSYGRVLTAKGPRTDLDSTTTYTYYSCTTGSQCGQIETITNALGQITTFNTYNAYGQPLTITDPNGVVTTLTYDLRQRLKSRELGTETTTYSYYPTGMLETVTLPDNSTVQYTYDPAHRLTDVTDGIGNHIHYTLDPMGNRTAISTTDPSQTLSYTVSRIYNQLNELYQQIAAAGTAAVTTSFGYDNNGNSTAIVAPLSRITSNLYDALNRISQVTDPANGIAKYSYDANDQLTSVTDPRGLRTTYTRNGFGEVTQQVSPDAGTTSNSYDSAGNLQTTTDARGAVGAYTYDALDRVTSEEFTGGYGPVSNTFTYDNCTYGAGRICRRTDTVGATQYTYTPQGRIANRTETDSGVNAPAGTFTLNYGYNGAGQLTSLQLPSGATVNYSYNGNNQIGAVSITVNGMTTPILNDVTYEPFGAVRGWTWGDGATVIRSHNTDGNAAAISSTGLHLSFQYDNAQRLTAATDLDTATLSWSYGYDGLDRLITAADAQVNEGWTYDADGNRLTQSGGLSGLRYTPQPSTSYNAANNQPTNYQYVAGFDAAGNATNYAYTSILYSRYYDAEGNYHDLLGQFVTNGLRQRVVTGVDYGYDENRTVYDDAGRVLGEYTYYTPESGYTPALFPQEETIWLGDLPVATLMGSYTYDESGDQTGYSQHLLYVHADQLGTPRRLTDPSNNNLLVWRWDSDPFGLGLPQFQLAGGSDYIPYNLRFQGQLVEGNNLFYSWYRDYDSVSGRYIESDPIGLQGGVNTYAYADENPIMRTDPLGLFSVGFNVTEIPTVFVPGLNDGYTTSQVTDLSCSCSPTCQGWNLNQCSGTLQVDVQLQRFLFPLSRAIARGLEQQHVDDYGAARSAIEADLTRKENSLKNTTYPDEKTCANASRAALRPALLDWQIRIARDSASKYDFPGGPHNH